MSPSLEEAAAELYAVEPGRFTAERTRLTKEARQAKDTEAAKAIGELRRPTTSAWLLNQLVRGEQGAGEEIDRLEQLGHELREAQAALDAQLMRELTKERHQLVAALVQRAEEIAEQAGQKVSAAVRRELEDTLGAAVADEQASLAVTSGRLTRALTYAGFGEVDVTEATATPLSAVHPYKARRSDTSGKPLPASASSKAETAGGESGTVGDESGTAGTGTGTAGSGPQNAPTMKRRDSKLAPAHPKSSPDDDTDSTGTSSRAHSRPAGKPENPEKPRQSPQEAKAAKLAARRAEAEELVSRARADFEAAEQSLRQSEQELDAATSEQADLQARLNELQAEIVVVRRKLDAGDRRVSHAERDLTRQERQVKDTTKALDRAEAALDRLDHA
ncbi:hypothetical protein Kisp01_64170 [Kineosporia sp. NBRC 101677]|uniref:hypothetical protein n=1 Tax=Kineosporia sp. NBRC 101677 TaxID=3032197 RepID=UPI0024A47E6F|nr:hypothetical protein [Kineosporia sp. NBRC 101677]GLY19403.1 hypothetical protein Kisp01_64170 [Kineosporia sp. NBRC 101677]